MLSGFFVFIVLLISLSYYMSWWVVASGLCFLCFISVFWWYDVGLFYEISFSFIFLDYFNKYLVSLTFFVSFSCVVASSYSILLKNQKSEKLFLFFMLASSFILVASFLSSNFISFFFFFECSLVPIVCLILNWGVQPERLLAVKYMSLYMLLSSVPLWVILGGFTESGFLLYYYFPLFSEFFVPEWWFFCYLVFLVKLPVFPFHLWLPKAHVEAPVSGSMILAGVMLKLGVYGMMRSSFVFSYEMSFYMFWLISVCCWGGFICCLICWRQVDIKSIIAYASIGHMAFCCAGVLSNTKEGFTGSYLMCLAHGVSSCGLFYIANSYYELYGTRKIMLMKGGLIVYPSLSFFIFLLLCCNFGFPPSMNWLSELLLYNSVIRLSSFFVFIFVLISFFTSVYSVHIYSALNHGHNTSYMKVASFYGDYLFFMQMSLHLLFLFLGMFFVK